MLQTTRSLVLMVAIPTVLACAPIQHTSIPQQQLNTPLIAGIGDVVLRIDKKKNLQNAFGASDVFGRKTSTGYIEVRFIGTDPSGEVILSRRDIQVLENETTMSRTPIAYTASRGSTDVDGSIHIDDSALELRSRESTNNQSITIESPDDYHLVVPSDSIPIRVTPSDRVVYIEGRAIEIRSVKPTSIEYVVR